MSARIIVFRPAPADPTDPVSATDVVVQQYHDALKQGRDPREYDRLHVAILTALEDLRTPVSAGVLHRWLRDQRLDSDFRNTPLYRRWVQTLEHTTDDARPITGKCPQRCWCVVSQLAFEFGFFDRAGHIDEAAFVAAVGRWAQQQERRRT